MSHRYNINLAHLMRFFFGLNLGPMFLAGYIITIGSSFHFGSDAYSMLLAALAFCFVAEYFLEISSGYRADIYGEKLTLFFACSFRMLYFILIFTSVALIYPTPILFSILVFVAYGMFAISYSLKGGNYEEWLQKQCDEKDSLKVFSHNYAYFYLGLLVGLASAIFLIPAYNYATLSTETLALFSISIFANCCSILLLFLIKNTKSFSAADIWPFFSSYFQLDKEKSEKTRKDIQQVKRELKEHKHLNRIYWVQANIYGIQLAYETLIPIYVFASQGFNVQQKFFIMIVCYLIPNIIGSLARSQKKSQSQNSDMLLAKESYFFFVTAILVALISVFPFATHGVWYMDPVFLAFGAAIILLQIATGRVFPTLYDQCSKRAREYSKLPKTLLSIGERRKKIGAILSLLISAIAGVFSFKEAYFMIVALMAIAGLFYSYSVFRRIHPENQKQNAEETA